MTISSTNPERVGIYDDGSSLFYGTGTKGPNSTDAGSPYESLGLQDQNGDTFNYTSAYTGKTTAATPNGYDNELMYSINGSDGESIAQNTGTSDFTVYDNNNKYSTDSQGEVSEDTANGGPKQIGNLQDNNIVQELRQSGMSTHAARDLRTAGRADTLNALASLHNNFSTNDLQSFDQLSNTSMKNQEQANGKQLSTGPLAESLDSILNFTPSSS